VLDRAIRRDILVIAVIICISLVASSLTVAIGTGQSIQYQKEQILRLNEEAANTLAGRFEFRIEEAIKVLQIAGGSEAFKQLGAIDKVSEDNKGIPETEDQAKRQIARDVLSGYENFETVAFVLPNGDIYFVEPYQNQLQLPRLNYADREWYQGALRTTQGYAADPISNAATGNKIVPIAVPLYSDEDGRLLGMITAGLNLETFRQKLLQELDLDNSKRVIFIDDGGNPILDLTQTTADTGVNRLSAMNEVVIGNAGNIVETIDGKELLEVYHPIIIGTEHWGLIMVQPTKDAFYALDSLRYQSYVMLAIIGVISAASGYLLIRSRVNSAVAKKLADANKMLIEKEKLKDEFLKLASHELRTPIQPIIGYSSLGARGLIKNDEPWKIVYKEAQRLMKLANNIVDITMAQSGVLRYNMERIQIAEIVRSSIDSFQRFAQERNLSLELEVDETFERTEIDGDAKRLRGVFGELLENAFKFTSKGSIRVSCATGTNELRIKIADTGTAIPADILPKIFDMFSSKSVNDPTTQGAGLGLFICKTIVSAHGGKISATNNSDSPGATFEVMLPRYQLKEIAPNMRSALS
jgi:signal transduction histidine kinase